MWKGGGANWHPALIIVTSCMAPDDPNMFGTEENLAQLTDRCTAIINWRRDNGSRRKPALRLTIDNGVVEETVAETPQLQVNNGIFN